ncbi:lactonase family protein [Paenibacillus ottowii]
MEEKKKQLFYIGALHMDNGDFRMVGGVEGVERPSFLALHPNGTKLYAASETDQGELYTYQVNTQTGELHPLDRKGTEGAHTCYAPSHQMEDMCWLPTIPGAMPLYSL